MHLLDVDALLVCVEFKDELLQVEERPLVPCVLPYLQQVSHRVTPLCQRLWVLPCMQQAPDKGASQKSSCTLSAASPWAAALQMTVMH